MYNRYIGNTGKVFRVEEKRDVRSGDGHTPPHHEPPHHGHHEPHYEPPPHRHEEKKPSLLGGLGGLGGGLIKSIDGALPFGMETADVILLILFLFLFIESGDEEFLIILGFLAYSIFKESREK